MKWYRVAKRRRVDQLHLTFHQRIMGIFQRLTRRAPAELRTRAQDVVSLAGIVAVMLNKAVEEDFPQTRPIPLRHWNHVLTAAGVAIAHAALSELAVPEYQVRDLTAIISDTLRTEDPTGLDLWIDCGLEVTAALNELRADPARRDDPVETAGLALGGWIVTRLFQQFPQEPWALDLARTLGLAVWEEMGGCWDD